MRLLRMVFATFIGTLTLVPAAALGDQPAEHLRQAQARAQEAFKEQKARLYDDAAIYSRLSGARRSQLSFAFGKKVWLGAYTGANVPTPLAATAAPFANRLVNNPAADATAQDTQSETAVVLGKNSRIVAAFNDSGSLLGGVSSFTGWSLSTNAGGSFTDKGTPPPSSDGDSGDPVLARSYATGTIFLATLSFNSPEKLLIFRSTDNGATFQAPVNGSPGFTPSTGSQDKEWIAVDNFPGPGWGTVYMFWRNFAAGGGMTFTRSTDDGRTWGPSPGKLITQNSGQGASVVVGKDHAVYLFWFDDSVTPHQIRMVKSTDHGNSFGAPVTVATLVASGLNGDLGLSPGFRTNSFPQAAVNPANGHLYIVYNDSANNGTSFDRGDIFFRFSTNGGQVWSPPIRVNDDATKNDQWQPALAVTPDGKRVGIAWYDRRLDPSNNLIDRFAAIGIVLPNGVAFHSSFRITDQAFAPVFGVDPVVAPTYMSDYDQMTADNYYFYTTWGDNRDNSTGHAGKNANVRFARFPVSGSHAALSMADGEAGEEEGQVIAVADLPAPAREALAKAINEAPPGVLNGHVTWEKAKRFGDTIAMFQVQGKDERGRDVEAEIKGGLVLEWEVKDAYPGERIPDAVTQGLRTQAPAGFQPTIVETIVMNGKIVSYGFEQILDPMGPGQSKTEIYLSPDGSVLQR